jgi:S-adenosylmethionine hydrolase
MATVTFLSDYGTGDDFVGVCHGVIARIAPDARVIDITHGIARHEVRSGAIVLDRSLAYMPAGVHLAVVDPGVGSERRAVALRCAGEEGRILVGPDNGLLWLSAQRFGGVAEAVDVGESDFALKPRSASFHGRDVFAPVAAHLAAGTPLERVGAPLDPQRLVTLDLPRAEVTASGLVAHVLHADRFGNAMLDARPEDLELSGLASARAVIVNGVRAARAATFADVPPGGLLLYEDSYGALALAINRGSALDALGLETYARVQITPA